MISKLIVWGEDRNEAIDRLYQALSDYKVIGFPNNIKFIKRVLLNETFKTGVFDTSFIAQNEKELLGDKPLTKEETLKQDASIALVNLLFENEKLKQKRKSKIDPWEVYDNFRINHLTKRVIKLQDKDLQERSLRVEYLSENKFNVYLDTDNVHPVLKNAEVSINREREGEILIKTDTE